MTPADIEALQQLEGVPPTISQELERKVTEEVERLVLGVQQGKVSPYGYQAGMQAIWGITAGLAGRESMELLTEALKSYPGVHRMRFAFWNGDAVLVLMWEVGATEFTVARKAPGAAPASTVKKAADDMPATAMKDMLRMVGQLHQSGWTDL